MYRTRSHTYIHTPHNSGPLDSFDDADDIELIYKSQYKKAAAKCEKTLTFIELFIANILCECCFSFKIEWILFLLGAQCSVLLLLFFASHLMAIFYMRQFSLNWYWIEMMRWEIAKNKSKRKNKSYLKKNLAKWKTKSNVKQLALIENNSKAYKQFDVLNWHIQCLHASTQSCRTYTNLVNAIAQQQPCRRGKGSHYQSSIIMLAYNRWYGRFRHLFNFQWELYFYCVFLTFYFHSIISLKAIQIEHIDIDVRRAHQMRNNQNELNNMFWMSTTTTATTARERERKKRQLKFISFHISSSLYKYTYTYRWIDNTNIYVYLFRRFNCLAKWGLGVTELFFFAESFTENKFHSKRFSFYAVTYMYVCMHVTERASERMYI